MEKMRNSGGYGEDTKNVIINLLTAFGIKGGSMFVALFTTPAYITYFSDDAVLGVWFTILSVLAWMLNFDLGIGNGVRNKLVETLSNHDPEESRRYISSAYLFLSGIALVLWLGGIVLIGYLPWNRLLGISADTVSPAVLLKAIRIVFCGIILQFVLRLITSIAFALQKSYVSALMNLCTNILLLLYTGAANDTGINGSIVTLAYVYLLAVNLPLITATAILFTVKLKDMRPGIRYFSMEHAKGTLKLGGIFLYLQITAMLMNNTANFLISGLLGAEQVVEYQLYYKLFHLISTITAIGIVPMWSAITKAMVEKRYLWLKRAIYFMFGLVGLAAVCEFLMVPALPFLFRIWLGENAVETDYTVGVIFAVFGCLFTWQQISSYISNGLGKLKIQVVCMTLGVIISFVFAFIFAELWNHYTAVTVGMILGYIPFCTAQTVWTLRYCRRLGMSES